MYPYAQISPEGDKLSKFTNENGSTLIPKRMRSPDLVLGFW